MRHADGYAYLVSDSYTDGCRYSDTDTYVCTGRNDNNTLRLE
jgi:hypothetical protein